MGKDNGMILFGTVLLGGLLLVGGCSNTVMNERKYSPAVGGDEASTDEFTQSPVSEVSSAPAPAPMPASAPETEVVSSPAPAPEPEPAVAPAPSNAPATYEPMVDAPSSNGVGAMPDADIEYVVCPGDTIGKIAKAYGVGIDAMLSANNLDLKKAKRIRPGQKLVIPASDKSAKRPVAKKTAPAKKAGTAKSKSTTLVGADGTYTVRAGDTISGIALKLGIKSRDLQNANQLTEAATRRLRVGQKLVVPGKDTPVQHPQASKVADADSDIVTNDSSKGSEAPVGGAPVVEKPDNPEAVEASANTESSASVGATTASEVSAPAPAPEKPIDELIGNSRLFEITDDQISLEDFAQKYKTTVTVLKQLNPELPKDGILRKGNVIFIPGE